MSFYQTFFHDAIILCSSFTTDLEQALHISMLADAIMQQMPNLAARDSIFDS